MAWNEHYIVPFKTKEGNDLAVKIYEDGYVGDVISLTPSDQPFTTQEDDDDDIFVAVRTQSGYLRVIDSDGTLMQQLMPENNTQRLVKLWQGTYSNSIFTEDTLKWQGFLQAQAYTQPWLDGATELEFPVKSLLGSLENVPLDTEYAFAYKPIVFVIYIIFDLLRVTPDKLVIISELRSEDTYFLNIYLSLSIFFSKKEISNEATLETTYIGDNALNIMKDILQLYGLTMREEGGDVYIAQYDYKKSRSRIFLWSEIEGMALNDASYLIRRGTYDTGDMMSSITFKGSDSEQTFTPGNNSVEVSLDIESELPPLLPIPTTDEDSTTPLNINVIDMDGNPQPPVIIQPHEPRTGGIETFSFYQLIEKYEMDSFFEDSVKYYTQGSSDYATFWSNLMLRSNRFSNTWPIPFTPVQYDFYTGAIPVRWGQGSSTTQARLQSGILLVQGSSNIHDGQWSSYLPSNPIYNIRSQYVADIKEGYLNIDMKINSFYNRTESGLSGVFVSPSWYVMKVSFRVGNQYWTGSSWSNNLSIFTMQFDGSNIVTNKTSSMDVDKSSGYFIPITANMTGDVEFIFYDGVATQQGHTGIVGQIAHKILSDFSVELLLTRDVVNSTRSTNVYRKTILERGFSEDKNVDLKIGTINNNPVSTSFIRYRQEIEGTIYPEELWYYNGNDNIKRRPELRLLDRIAWQVNKVRMSYIATIQQGLEVMHTLYTKDGRFFNGIRSQTNWRDETEEMKFIEVTQSEAIE